MKQSKHDIIIIGAGIAGLWSFNLLNKLGYDVVLLEKDVIGGTQSLASQGMIHGGQRYALEGKANKHSQSIAAMPGIWEDALAGKIDPDLSAANVLSQKQYMWSPGGLTSNVTSFFASKAMNSRVDALEKDKWPKIFKDHPKFKGKIYELDEVVLDIPSVAKVISEPFKDKIIKATNISYDFNKEELQGISLEQNGETCQLTARKYLFTAGLGNEEIADKLWPNEKMTQRRPLKQIIVRDIDYAFYGHCITVDPRPRVTVSAHPDGNGKYTWYLGGLVAVKHIDSDDQTAIQFAKDELKILFPQIDWENKVWETLKIDRAEPYTSTGFLPEGPALKEKGDCLLAWPTKLTYAPAIADKLLDVLKTENINPTTTAESTANFIAPEYGDYPWSH